ncbi:MAG: nucleoside-diphosphate sugar epimerase/dehydratase [Actinomycetes bacterium]
MTQPHPEDGPSFFVQAGQLLERHRHTVQLCVDFAAWAIGIYAGMSLRFDSLYPNSWTGFKPKGVLIALAIAVCGQAAAGLFLGLYRGVWRFGSMDEAAHLLGAAASAAAFLTVVNFLLIPSLVPASVAIAAGALALIVMAVVRYTWRWLIDRQMRPTVIDAIGVIIYGAGEGGIQTVTAMLRNPQSPFVPVAMLDDDPGKRNLRFMGLRVSGGRDELKATAAKFAVDTVVIAIPAADSELLREITDIAAAADLRVFVLPPISELFDGSIRLGDIRPINEVDLLGRHVVDTDVDSIAGYLTGRRVLVTGAGGSIGSELCYQISRFAPAGLVMVDRDESALHGLQLRLEGRALLDSRSLVVCDIRDLDRLHQVFAEHAPEVVFHAAALKHLSLLEMHPGEGVKTNIRGTQNVIDAAREAGVQEFVNISTDKAADPISVLGFTKRIAERLTAHAALETNGAYLSVRFGNVLGSSGSVLKTFHAQIQAGGPVTVTDPEVTRYFMTIEEAVELVIQAGAIGRGGEVLVLDMGEPVRIASVAERLVSGASRPIEITYTGLRPGEKLHEALLASDEVDSRPSHPLISQVVVPPLAKSAISEFNPHDLNDDAQIAIMKRLSGASGSPITKGNAMGNAPQHP